jgi:hypothetical protein
MGHFKLPCCLFLFDASFALTDGMTRQFAGRGPAQTRSGETSTDGRGLDALLVGIERCQKSGRKPVADPLSVRAIRVGLGGEFR